MKNFLNYTNDLFDAYDRAEQLGDIYDVNKAREDMQGELAKAISFYNTPFKPELITELFEGWVKQNYKEGKTAHKRSQRYFTYEINNGTINQWKEFVGYRINWTEYQDGTIFYHISYHSGKNPSEDRWDKMPKTLNDFISDCSRAGISLELKAEIKEKYGL